MARSQNQVSIVFRAIDELTGTVGRIDRSLKNLNDTFGTLGGRIKAGIQWHLVYRGIGMVTRAVDELVNAIPNLIRRGQEWADTVDRIADVTGMTAEQSSELAAVAKMVGVNVEGMGRNLSFLAKSAVYNRDAFKEWGVQTRGQNGRLLSSYQIFQNVRKRVSEVGAGFLSTARAQKVLGRGTLDLMDVLLLSNNQYGMLAAQARKSGLILNQAALDAGEAWNRTRSMLDLSLTGIGAQVMNKVAPVLIRLVNGISEAINANMDRIATFVAQVAAFIAGVIGGFLGIDFNMKSLMETVQTGGNAAQGAGKKYQALGGGMKDAAKGADTLNKALQKQIDAIDRQLARLDKQERKADARRQQRELLADIAAARAELEDTRSASIFAAGMTYAEEELARQAQAQAIIDAEKKVAEAKKKLRQFQQDQERQAERDRLQARRDALQKEMSAHTAALSKMVGANAAATRQLSGVWNKGSAGLSTFAKNAGKVSEEMQQAVKDALAFGKAFSQDILTFLFGPKKLGLAGGTAYETRSGGLLKGLQDLQKWIADAVPFWKTIADNIVPLTVAIIGWKLGLVGLLRNLLPGGGGGGTPPTPTGTGSPKGPTTPTGTGSPKGPGMRPVRIPAPGGGAGGGSGFWGTVAKVGAVAALTAGIAVGVNLVIDQILGNRPHKDPSQYPTPGTNPELFPPPGGWGPAGPPSGKKRTRELKRKWMTPAMQSWLAGVEGGASPATMTPGMQSWLAGAGKPWKVVSSADFNPGLGGAINPWQANIDAIFRRYVGPSSPLVSGQRDQTDATDATAAWSAATAGNTTPLSDGTLGVQNQKFGDIGTIQEVKGKVPVDASGKRIDVDASGKTVTVWTPNGRKLPTEGGGKGGTVGLPLSFQSNIKYIRQYSAETRQNTGQTEYYTKLMVGQLDSIRKAVGGSVPNYWISGGGSNQRNGGVQRISIQLDQKETRRFLRGDEVTTSLRPVPGV